MRVRRFALTLALTLAVVLPSALLSGQGKVPSQAQSPSGLSIVQLAEFPVVAYAGGIPGTRRRSRAAARRSIRSTRRSSCTPGT